MTGKQRLASSSKRRWRQYLHLPLVAGAMYISLGRRRDESQDSKSRGKSSILREAFLVCFHSPSQEQSFLQ